MFIDCEPDKPHWGWSWLERWMAARPWENRVADGNSKADPDEASGHSTDDAESSKIVEVDFVKQNYNNNNGNGGGLGKQQQHREHRGGLISQSGPIPNDGNNNNFGPQRERSVLPQSGPLVRDNGNSSFYSNGNSQYSNGNSHYSNASSAAQSRYGNGNGNGLAHYETPTTPKSTNSMPPLSPLTPPLNIHKSMNMSMHPIRSASPRRAPKRDDEEVSTASTTGRSAPSLNHRFGTRYSMGPSLAASIRDDESLASSPSVPNYMQITQSARAKVRSHSTPKSRPGTPEKDLTPAKKRLSFPAGELSTNSNSSARSQKMSFYSVRSPSLKGLSGPNNIDRFTMPSSIRDRDRDRDRDSYIGDPQLSANGALGDLRQRPFR